MLNFIFTACLYGYVICCFCVISIPVAPETDPEDISRHSFLIS